MARRSHTHKCSTCHEPFPCGGVLSSNPDGIPTVWCSAYDRGEKLECETCATAVKCSWCGEPLRDAPAVTEHDHQYHAACVTEMREGFAVEIR